MGAEWKQEFATGVSEIDNQHKELFARFDRFLRATDEGKGGEEVERLIGFLSDYTRSHFALEEELQARFAYPHFSLHREEHRAFLKELDGLKKKMALGGGSPELARLAGRTLLRWLVGHVCATDRRLGEFVNEHRNDDWETWLRDNF